MLDSEVSFFLFPIGIGEEDVTVRGEVPVALIATADAAVAASSQPRVDAGQVHLQPDLNLLQSSRPHTGHVTFDAASTTPTHREVNSLHDARQHQTTDAVVALHPTSPFSSSPQRQLQCRLHYTAASYLCEVQRGAALGRCLPLPTSLPSSSFSFSVGALISPVGGFVELAGGQRCYYVCPVEDNRYLAAVSLPSFIWEVLGGGQGDVVAHWLLHTTLIGVPLPLSRIGKRGNGEGAGAEQVSYTPLHTRLTSAATAVQQTMAGQVKTLADFAKNCALLPTRYAARAAAIRRVCTEDVSDQRAHPRLGQRVDELLRNATSPTTAASLRGALPTMGLCNSSERRYVTTAFSMWYRGHPLCGGGTSSGLRGTSSSSSLCSSASDSTGEQLRVAAFGVMLEELKSLAAQEGEVLAYGKGDDAPVRVTTQCFAHAPRCGSTSHVGARPRTGGYVNPSAWPSVAMKSITAAPPTMTETPATLPNSGVSVAVTSSSGWTLVLLLQPLQTPFVGSPLSLILRGVQDVLMDEVESDRFLSFAQEATAAMRSTWRRPVQLLSPLTAQLEAAVTSIQVRRRLSAAAPFPDVVLYDLDAAALVEKFVKPPSSFSPSSRLRSVSSNSKQETKRKKALIASHADAQRRRSLVADSDIVATSAAMTRGRTSHCLAAGVEATVQAAMRYVLLMSRLRRCVRNNSSSSGNSHGCSRGDGCFVNPLMSSSALQLPRSQSVNTSITEESSVRLVHAAPCCSRSSSAVVYVVVEVDRKKMPANAHEECRAFTSWILSKCV